MMPPQRPGQRKKQPERSVPDLVVILEGERHEVRLDETSARDATGIRHATGRSMTALLSELREDGDPDIDVIAALVWLARRQAGEQTLSYDKVAASITYASDFDVQAGDDTDGEEVDDLGEVPAAD